MWCSGKESVSSAEDVRDVSSIPWSGKIPWRRKWQPTPVFSPEKSHGHRSLVGYGLWGCGGSDAAEQLSMYPVRAILVYVWLLSCSSSETLNKLLNLPYLSCFFLGAKLKITILTLPHCSED